MASKYPRDRASIEFRPAFSGNGGDLDHEGPTRRAYLTDTYGLVIHTSVISNIAPRWAVSHTRSGRAVAYADTWEAALILAGKLGECGPWNRDHEDIMADRVFRTVAHGIVKEYGVSPYRRPDPLR